MPDDIGWPLSSNVIRRNSNSNTFGMVRRRANGSKKPHQGWDFTAVVGTPCYAVAAGTVVYLGTGAAYGLTIVHSFVFGGTTYYAAYAHMQSANVGKDDVVTKGQLIGLTGESGNAKGMAVIDQHLHFEVRTVSLPGLGLSGRVSPYTIFGTVPLLSPVAGPGGPS
jgi:peptidoglycan LD-endopeptidase LytH